MRGVRRTVWGSRKGEGTFVSRRIMFWSDGKEGV